MTTNIASGMRPVTLAIVLLALIATPALSDEQAHEHAHPPSPLRHLSPGKPTGLSGDLHTEHQRSLALCEPSLATVVAKEDGPWSLPQTWEGAEVPQEGGRVWIPPGRSVTVDRVLENRLDCVHVDGQLAFSNRASTALSVQTVIVSPTGSMAIGTEASPILPPHSARLTFLDRGPRDRVRDPLDLGGGLIVHGGLSIHGASIDSFATVATGLTAGTQTLSFDSLPLGWKAGDELLIPSTRDPRLNEDEVVTIDRIGSGGREIILASPLSHDHPTPDGVRLPVGNLTRNVTVASDRWSPTTARGHVMIMHRQAGTTIRGAGFYGLGRTDARVPHTFPSLDRDGHLRPGSDDNPAARYPLHFHIRSGPRAGSEPQLVEGCSIVDSPKHGLVNHGGNVVAENNVSYKVDASHFFGENGSEIGAFRRNLAVRSAPGRSAPAAARRRYVSDFADSGSGFWVQGGGIEVSGNYAFGHRTAAYAFNGLPIYEAGTRIRFSAKNLADPSIAQGKESILPERVPFRFSDNVAATSRIGLFLWGHQRRGENRVKSIAENSTFWSIEDFGVYLPYSRNVHFRNLSIHSAESQGTAGVGGVSTDSTSDMVFEGMRVTGFKTGIEVPTIGTSVVRGGWFDNEEDLKVVLRFGTGFEILLDEPGFASRSDSKNIVLDGEILRTRSIPGYGNLGAFFDEARILLKQPGSVRQLFFREQHPDHIPFVDTGINDLDGLTNRELWDRHALAPAGFIAPVDAVTEPKIVGLAGPVGARQPRPMMTSTIFVRNLAGYTLRARSRDGRILSAPAMPLREGWNLLSLTDRDVKHTFLVYGDTTPPVAEIPPSFEDRVHPDDLAYGVVVFGRIRDQIAHVPTRMPFTREFHDLAPAKDGTLQLEFEIEDAAGNRTPVAVTIHVDPAATRRGSRANHFSRLDVRAADQLPPRSEGP